MRLGVLLPLGAALYFLIGGMLAQKKAGKPTIVIADRAPTVIRWFGITLACFGMVMMFVNPEAPWREFTLTGLAFGMVRRCLDFTERGVLNWTSFVPWRDVTGYRWVTPQTVTLETAKSEIKLLVPAKIMQQASEYLRQHVSSTAAH